MPLELMDFDEIVPWLRIVEADPVRYVEELSLYGMRLERKYLSGWYDENDPSDYVMFHSASYLSPSMDPLTGTVYMSSKRCPECFLQRVPYRKFYLQTDSLGAEVAESLFSVAHRGIVRYFCLPKAMHSLEIHTSPRNDIIWSVSETTSIVGTLRGLGLKGKINGIEAVSATTPFLNSLSAMIGVETNAKYRNQGLGLHAVSLLAARLLDLGRISVYATDILNEPSMRIANRLFEPHVDFEFLFIGPWNLDRPEGVPSCIPDSLFMK